MESNESISEKLLEKALCKRVKTLGGFCIKLLSPHIKGLPDRLILLPGGIIFFAEIKTTGKKTTKFQNYIIKKIRNLGFKVFVVDTKTKINEITSLSNKGL